MIPEAKQNRAWMNRILLGDLVQCFPSHPGTCHLNAAEQKHIWNKPGRDFLNQKVSGNLSFEGLHSTDDSIEF